jgi:hypothetical protein
MGRGSTLHDELYRERCFLQTVSLFKISNYGSLELTHYCSTILMTSIFKQNWNMDAFKHNGLQSRYLSLSKT